MAAVPQRRPGGSVDSKMLAEPYVPPSSGPATSSAAPATSRGRLDGALPNLPTDVLQFPAPVTQTVDNSALASAAASPIGSMADSRMSQVSLPRLSGDQAVEGTCADAARGASIICPTNSTVQCTPKLPQREYAGCLDRRLILLFPGLGSRLMTVLMWLGRIGLNEVGEGMFTGSGSFDLT